MDKKIRAVVTSISYAPPENENPRLVLRVRRKARKGAGRDYGDSFFELELEFAPWQCRNLVREVRNGMTKVKEDRAADLKSAETWLNEIQKAATA